MDNGLHEEEQDGKPLLQRLRTSVFPIKPTDTAPQKLLKHSAFYLFAVMALLVTLLLGGAIMFVL